MGFGFEGFESRISFLGLGIQGLGLVGSRCRLLAFGGLGAFFVAFSDLFDIKVQWIWVWAGADAKP